MFLLQALLIEHGYFQDRATNRDGRFGEGTERKVVEFKGRQEDKATAVAAAGIVEYTRARIVASS